MKPLRERKTEQYLDQWVLEGELKKCQKEGNSTKRVQRFIKKKKHRKKNWVNPSVQYERDNTFIMDFHAAVCNL
jgi:hypothetical protein